MNGLSSILGSPKQLRISEGLVRGELLDSEKLWITTPSMSVVIELEETSDGFTIIGDPSDPATLLFELHMNSSMITSAQIGISPWAPVDYANYTSPERLMLIGNQMEKFLATIGIQAKAQPSGKRIGYPFRL